MTTTTTGVDAPIDPDTFKARLTPTAVVVSETLRVDVFCDDGDLFAGHAVIVSLAEDGRPCQTQLLADV